LNLGTRPFTFQLQNVNGSGRLLSAGVFDGGVEEELEPAWPPEATHQERFMLAERVVDHHHKKISGSKLSVNTVIFKATPHQSSLPPLFAK